VGGNWRLKGILGQSFTDTKGTVGLGGLFREKPEENVHIRET